MIRCPLVCFVVVLTCFSLVGSINVEPGEDGSNYTVKITQGELQGVILLSTSGRKFHAFRGVPFGQVKERFTAPKAAETWKGVFNATVEGPDCKQYDSFMGRGFYGEEDCLNLNVYTPKLPGDAKTSRPLPVMVFFFGGGFLFGSSSADWYGPERYMNNDIVLVIPQYRVGPFGFLSTADEASPGNYGLIDQSFALRWVKENIKAFGGDPNKVAISGISAGGGSVVFHLLSPLSKGLFHGAIAQSGSALCPWGIHKRPLEAAQKLAKELDCPLNNTREMVECLRKVDGNDILRAANDSSMFESLLDSTHPVIENTINGQFLTESPWKIMKEGRFNKVPFISGFTRDEGSHIATMKFPGIDNMYNVSKEIFLGDNLPKILSFLMGKEFNQTITETIVNMYFQNTNFSDPDGIRRKVIELISDVWFKGCSDVTVKLAVGHGVPIRSYLFDYATAEHQLSNFTGRPDVNHGMDFRYLFKVSNEIMKFHSNLTDEEDRLVANMVNMFGNFTESGNPTQDDVIQWAPITSDEINYLHITANPTMETDQHQANNSNFWIKIFDDSYV